MGKEKAAWRNPLILYLYVMFIASCKIYFYGVAYIDCYEAEMNKPTLSSDIIIIKQWKELQKMRALLLD
jgi:hypothetical protein